MLEEYTKDDILSIKILKDIPFIGYKIVQHDGNKMISAFIDHTYGIHDSNLIYSIPDESKLKMNAYKDTCGYHFYKNLCPELFYMYMDLPFRKFSGESERLEIEKDLFIYVIQAYDKVIFDYNDRCCCCAPSIRFIKKLDSSMILKTIIDVGISNPTIFKNTMDDSINCYKICQFFKTCINHSEDVMFYLCKRSVEFLEAIRPLITNNPEDIDILTTKLMVHVIKIEEKIPVYKKLLNDFINQIKK